ncbi:MAG: DUF349 domain-containing protein [Marinilabiliaceae bacterium]|nr:DUF349 domain-containing protein [Marinilabiliaceae bacterium]
MENTIENAAQEQQLTQGNSVEAEKETITNVEPSEEPQAEAEQVEAFVAKDVNTLNREELVKYLRQTIEKQPITTVSTIIKDVRERFDKLSTEEREARHEKFIADGGVEQDFDKSPDILEQNMKSLQNLYNDRYKAYNAALEKEYKQNALIKNNIIENITNLLQKGDSYENSKQIRELTQQWKNVGRVPADEANDINSRYKRCLEQYHQNIALSREMREIDHKRNYERKVELCEQAEKLAEQTSAAKAFRAIQQLHAEWKQIGAVAQEDRDAIWQRFKAATAVINDRFHKLVEGNKEQEKKNYEAKLALIEEAKKIQEEPAEKAKEIEGAVKKITEIQERWRKIGFAPKEFNDKIYSDFRHICEQVYDRRRKFFRAQNAEWAKNLTEKIALCEEAEKLQDSTDWRDTTNKLIELQKRWKTIGPVTRKQSDEVWKRFRAACDRFFENKEKSLNAPDPEQIKNLEAKTALLAQIEASEEPESNDEKLKQIQQFRQQWNAIGHVPKENRNEINKKFSSLMSARVEKISGDSNSRQMLLYRTKIEDMAASEDGANKVQRERNELIFKLRQAEQETTQLENNVGFFSKSANSEGVVKDIMKKIEASRNHIRQINEKLDIIDSIDKD